MAPKGRKEGRPPEMPDEPVRRSERIEQRKRQTEAKKPRQSLQVAEIPRKEVHLQHSERQPQLKQQEQGTRRGRASTKKVISSKISKSRSQKEETLKQTETGTGLRSKKTTGRPKTLQVEEQPPGNERQEPESATEGQLQRVATASAPKASNKRTKPPPASSQLSRAALHQLRRQTANDPFPKGIRQYKQVLSEDDMAKSANDNVAKDKATTVYSQSFIDELEDRGILDQQFKADDTEKPSNYNQIRKAITKARPQDQPSKADYKIYTEQAFSVSNEDEVKELYTMFFGDVGKIKQPHSRLPKRKWNRHQPIIGEADPKDCKRAPYPDLVEGLVPPEVPGWIRKRLKGYSVPRGRLAFPNYLVELKRDASMFTAHVQNRHCGAVAAQSFVEFFVQLPVDSGPSCDPARVDSPAFDAARVGSIEFNGDVVVGNIHWVSSSDKLGQNRKVRRYHMTRVMCHFTYGLDFEDFKIARKEARNFKEYFLDDRAKFLEDCRKLPQPPNEVSSSVGEEAEEDSNDESGENDDNDSGDSGQQEASRSKKRKTIKPARKGSGRKRQENQPAARSRGRPRKKSKPGRQSIDIENDEPTGLTQETEGWRIG